MFSIIHLGVYLSQEMFFFPQLLVVGTVVMLSTWDSCCSCLVLAYSSGME